MSKIVFNSLTNQGTNKILQLKILQENSKMHTAHTRICGQIRDAKKFYIEVSDHRAIINCIPTATTNLHFYVQE